jgi:acetyl-CoA synthetase
MTCSGGDSAIAADLAAAAGIELPELAQHTVARLERVLPAAATAGNPLDYTSLLWDDVVALRELVAALEDDPAVGRVLVLFDAYDGPAPILDAIGGEVVLASTLPELASEGAVGGIRAGLLAAQALAHRPDPERIAAMRRQRRTRGRPIGEPEAKAILRAAGVPVPEGRVARAAEEAVAIWRELGPVAMKSTKLRHKSAGGGVALNVDSETDVRDAFERGLMFVEQMAEPGLELLVSVDRTGFAPVLVVGLGGVHTELLDRAEIIPLPAPRHRIDPRVAEIALTLQRLDLALIELNPVIVNGAHAIAVDALCDEEVLT